MSRSYRKTPRIRYSCKFFKKVASRKLRRYPHIVQNSSFKKIYETYDICDHVCSYYTKKDFLTHEYSFPSITRIRLLNCILLIYSPPIKNIRSYKELSKYGKDTYQKWLDKEIQ